MSLTETKAHLHLCAGAEAVKSVHLRTLLNDEKRQDALFIEAEGIVADFSRQKLRLEDFNNLLALARERGLVNNIEAMFSGSKVNKTEDRAVLHVALRAPASRIIRVVGENVIPAVHHVLQSIERFSQNVRSGSLKGFTGKTLTDVICIGIGGSYLGSEFVYEAMRTDPLCAAAAKGRRLHFLPNVDPIDMARATEQLDPETTLVIIISKTFTTAETMLNARTLKSWLLDKLKDPAAIAKHMVAVSTNVSAAADFGLAPENVFGFWDWVGGRFSVCSAVGCLPLALHFGYSHVQEFLKGCHAMDEHFRTAPLEANLPVLMGLISLWNSTYLGYGHVAVLPYCQALLRFAAHIQQLTMESNGKRVTVDGKELGFQAGEIFFGEPGTNGQHSFYQLLHQGRVVPAEFIGFIQSQNPIKLPNEPVTNHDELMSNFFAQPDALALGKTAEECRQENVPEALIPHKVFPGDRPSMSLLFQKCTPYTLGQLLALYEHRTAVQGFLWGINSFDQWGVELGKVLAKNVRNYVAKCRNHDYPSTLASNFPKPTVKLLRYYLSFDERKA